MGNRLNKQRQKADGNQSKTESKEHIHGLRHHHDQARKQQLRIGAEEGRFKDHINSKKNHGRLSPNAGINLRRKFVPALAC